MPDRESERPDDRIRIVYVEDDERLARLTAQYLRSEQVDAFLVTRGERAVAEVLAVRPDVVVLDLNLPDIDGLQVCTELRRHVSVPIIMVTARTDEPDRVIGLEGGADDYVAKPFSPRELLARFNSPPQTVAPSRARTHARGRRSPPR